MSKLTGAALGMAAALAASAGAALADPPPAAGVMADGNVPAGCAFGAWQKDSGPGTFAGGKDAVVTYANSDLVDGSAMSVVSAATAVTVHAPLVCNTGITWSISVEKGALRQDLISTPPAGFSNQWLYSLGSSMRNAGGGAVGSTYGYESDGTPFNTETHFQDVPTALQIASLRMTFSPSPQTGRMLAGNYSEKITVTVQPSF